MFKTNVILTVAAVAIFLVFLASFLMPQAGFLEAMVDPSRAKAAQRDILTGTFFSQKHDVTRSFIVSNKRLFRMPQESKPRNIQPVLENRKDILQDIVLVGIMDDKGRKAIVEDKKASKTYFLSVGDSFAGVQVVEIKDNEVIFNKEGNQCSLML